MVKAGIIRPSTSAFSAPTFCVKKPVEWIIVHDYRQLNASTIVSAIPMPRKEDTFEAMSGSHWFSCMDLLSGYYQVRLSEKDIPFTAFSTLMNSSSTKLDPWDYPEVQELLIDCYRKFFAT